MDRWRRTILDGAHYVDISLVHGEPFGGHDSVSRLIIISGDVEFSGSLSAALGRRFTAAAQYLPVYVWNVLRNLRESIA